MFMLPACFSSPQPAEPEEVSPQLEPLTQPDPWRASQPQTLADFVPPTYLGEKTTVARATEDAVRATWTAQGRSFELEMDAIGDVVATRASFELLGKDVVARMDGAEIRGLRVQGNPAQARRDLATGEATLSVVAVNTWLVTLRVSPVADIDELLLGAEGLDIGGMTVFAIRKHKEGLATPQEKP